MNNTPSDYLNIEQIKLADLIIENFLKDDNQIEKLTAKRLYKLMFYTYVEYARENGKSLFSREQQYKSFRPWKTIGSRGPVPFYILYYYPVSTGSYNENYIQKYKSEMIPCIFNKDGNDRYQPNPLYQDEEICSIVYEVLKRTSKVNTKTLIDKVVKGTPWEDNCNKINKSLNYPMVLPVDFETIYNFYKNDENYKNLYDFENSNENE